jgi:predicted nucleic acid-binding protein
LLFLTDVRDRLTLITLDEQVYVQMEEACGTAGLTGGTVYDAILGYCALKADADVIYRWNTKDFLRLPPAISGRVQAPDQAEG